MTFLRILGAAFLVAGVVACFADPNLRMMGGSFILTAALMLSLSWGLTRSSEKEARVLATGKAGRATILEVVDTGITMNESPRVRLKVRIDVPGEPPIEATRAVFVSRVAPPRVGEVREVRFDPQQPNDFAFAPTSALPVATSPVATSPDATRTDDRLGQLERLANLRDRGALSHEEFESAKRKLLAGGL
jgi:hypothetical protein